MTLRNVVCMTSMAKSGVKGPQPGPAGLGKDSVEPDGAVRALRLRVSISRASAVEGSQVSLMICSDRVPRPVRVGPAQGRTVAI